MYDLQLQQQYYQMTGRYERTDPLTLYHHQKSHYEHIFNPRSTMRLQPQNRRSFSMQRKNKSSNEKDRIRKIENKKMLNHLLDIYNNKPGLLTRVEEQSKQKSTQKRRAFFSSYKKEQEEKEIQKNNRDLFYSILHTGPSIGNHKEWEEHYEKHLKMQKKLCNHLTNDYQAMNPIRQSSTKEKMKRSYPEQSGRQRSNSHQQQRANETVPTKLNQRKKKWQKKKANLIQKGLKLTQKQDQNPRISIQL